MDNKDLQLMF